MRRSLLLLPLLAIGCTPDYDLGKVEPEEDGGPQIELDPTSLFFGTAAEGTELTQTFSINSIGATALMVSEVRLDAPEAFSLTTFEARILPDESRDVVVTYTATGAEDLGEALVFSDDPASPHIVTLNGGGLSPELTIDPAGHDFGYVAAGSSDQVDFALRNSGGATLEITSVDTTDAVFGYVLADSLPISLEPGEESTVTVTFTPDDGDSWSGLLEVMSNDPMGMKTATLDGTGAVDQPLAICEADPAIVEAIHESTTWKGNASYDPSGAAISDYEWTLVSKPSGSSAVMPAGSGANRSGFTPDVVGIYEAELVVTNEYGERSEPCTATLEALPGGDVWIEMFWTHGGDDMDLHLLKPGGSLRSANGDCYYLNCTGRGLDWGTSGDTSDNPVLDLDDIPGTGPENINIDDPANGTYTVYVNDYPGSTYNGNNDVTVNIYIGGLLEWTDTRNVNTENADEAFAEIEWPSGAVNPL